MPPEDEGKPLSKLALDSINTSVVDRSPTVPDSRTLLEKETLEAHYLREKIRSLSQDIDERKKYAHRIFCLICGWLGITFAVLIADGIQSAKWFSLPQPVLLALIGGTSADVLGIFYIVTHYLFPNLTSSPSDESPDLLSEPADSK
jgi:hypothetical protein